MGYRADTVTEAELATALVVDAVAATGSLRTLGTGSTQAAQGSVLATHTADTANPHTVTKTQVGLGSVDNTADTAKPVSTTQQTALDLKAPLASPVLTGNPTAPTQSAGNNSTRVATTAYADTASGLMVPQALVDAKGDLLVGTADNTVARKAVGTDGQSIIVDASQTDGLRWTYPRMALQQRSAMPTAAAGEGGVGRAATMSSQAALTTATLRLGSMLVLPKSVAVNTITLHSGSTAASVPLNQWFCLVRVSDLAVLMKTADDTTAAWGTNAIKTLTLSSAYTPTTDELVYIGVLVVATTVPTLAGWSCLNATLAAVAPIFAGNSTAALTNPASLGGTAGAITASAASFYGYVS